MIDILTTPRLTMRVDEVVDAVGVTRRTVYYWLETAKILGVPDGHGGTRVDVISLRSHLDRNPPKVFRERSVQITQVHA